MKQYFLRYRYAILAFFAVVAGAGVWQYRAESARRARAWQSLPVEQGSFRVTVPATGAVEPENRIVVMAPVAGRIEDILVEEGGKVRRGQTLARMSSTDRAALLDMAEAQGLESRKRWAKEYLPTPILAPADGIVIKRGVVPGQTVGGQSALFEISDRLVIRAEVDETDIGKIRVKQAAQVRLDAYPELDLAGKVTKIAHQSQLTNSVTTYEVTIVPHELSAEIRSGMTVTVNFVVEEKPEAKLLPSWIASGLENGEVEVFVRGERGSPVKRKIRVGHNDGRRIEVLSGLELGEVIMYLPVKFLKEKASGFTIFGGKGK